MAGILHAGRLRQGVMFGILTFSNYGLQISIDSEIIIQDCVFL